MLKTLANKEAEERQHAPALLRWYDAHGRTLPWRGVSGPHADYKVWLSEIMLQQTTIITATPYYEAFLERWPRVHDLAEAALDDVLQAWAGLGYYARARNLHKCAQHVVAHHACVFPTEEQELLALPGIGPYTAAAMSAILADAPSVVVDGNVERVISRLYAIKNPLPKSKGEIRSYAASLTPKVRAGDYAQAIMDLGATICTPKNPKCGLCPWQKDCKARQLGRQQDFPKKGKKAKKPQRFGTVFWVEDESGRVLLEKRPDQGLFGGMWVFPGTNWQLKEATVAPTIEEITAAHPGHGEAKMTGLHIRHVFTHFDLKLDIATGRMGEGQAPKNTAWIDKTEILNLGLPSAMKKVATLML